MFSDLTCKKTNGRTSAAARGHVGVLANKFWKRLFCVTQIWQKKFCIDAEKIKMLISAWILIWHQQCLHYKALIHTPVVSESSFGADCRGKACTSECFLTSFHLQRMTCSPVLPLSPSRGTVCQQQKDHCLHQRLSTLGRKPNLFAPAPPIRAPTGSS